MLTPDFKKLANRVKAILLIDWPNKDIPISLLQSGFTVYSYSPSGFSEAELIDPEDVLNLHQGPLLSSADQTNAEKIIFRTLEKVPDSYDLVCIYRPPEEHVKIIHEFILPSWAKIIWLQKPIESEATKNFAKENGFDFIQGYDIRELISQ